MKKLLLISVIASLAAFCSCSNEDENLGANQVYDKVVATIESDGSSRTTMNGTYVNWVKDDQIGIFFQGGDNKAYTLVGDGGSTSGEFGVEAPIEEGAVKVLAYYPYSSKATYESEVLNIDLEAEHTYSATSNNGFPMIAKIGADSQDKIQFKNAGAILAVTVKNLPTEYAYVTLSAADNDSKIAGKAKIAYDDEGQPKLEIVEDNSNSSTIKIKLDESRTEVIEECTFYFPLPVANYSKLTFSLHKSESDEPVVGKEKALNAARNMRYNATLVFDKVSTDIVTETTSTSAATEALSNGASSVQVSVAADEQKPTITLPSSDENASINLYFDKIEATTAITIAETSDATTNAAVTIAAPESDGETNNNNFNIELPNSTVTLAANGESATYNEVTASTAENTLIISKGVTVNTLKVKKGNVRVHGEIGEISYEGGDSETIYIIQEEGATIPETTTGFVVMSAAEWNLRKAIENGGDVTLAADVTLKERIVIEKDAVLDLGGKTLTFEVANGYSGIKNTATLTVKNGKIVSNQIGVQNNGTLNINCEIESASTAINNVYGGVATIDGGSYKSTSTEYALISSNNFGEGLPQLTINGGTFESPFTNVSFNNSSKGAVNAGTFKCTGNWHNIYVGGASGGCDVTYTAENCTFESNGINIQVNDWGKGNTNTVNGTAYTSVHNIYFVGDENGLKIAVAAGGDVTLTADVALKERIVIEKDAVLDLGGKTLTFEVANGYSGIKNTATLTVKNGKIVSNQIGVQNNGTLNINCEIESASTAINNVYGGVATIDGGSYKSTSTEYALISSNNFGEGLPQLTINGGTFESPFTNVSFNNSSKGAVNAGTFKCTGNWHNIYVGGASGGCDVTYTAENCTFESNGINIQVNDWGKGNTNTVNGTKYSVTTTLME